MGRWLDTLVIQKKALPLGKDISAPSVFLPFLRPTISLGTSQVALFIQDLPQASFNYFKRNFSFHFLSNSNNAHHFDTRLSGSSFDFAATEEFFLELARFYSKLLFFSTCSYPKDPHEISRLSAFLPRRATEIRSQISFTAQKTISRGRSLLPRPRTFIVFLFS